MAKNKSNKVTRHVEEDLFHDDFFDTSYHQEGAGELMQDLLSTSNNQAMLALELTRLAIQETDHKPKNAEEVFLVFKQAANIIAENRPLKSLLDTLFTKEEHSEYPM